MLKRSNLDIAYIFDGTPEGLYTAVFEAYARKEDPIRICIEENYQESLTCVCEIIKTDEEKYLRVKSGINNKINPAAQGVIEYAFMSCNPERFTGIYNYIKKGFEIGPKITDHLLIDEVRFINKINAETGREQGKLTSFTRFSVMEQGIQYAEITPQNNQVPLLMPHFTVRLVEIPFILHDTKRKLAGVHYKTGHWYLAGTEDFTLPEFAPEEEAYRNLWRRFYNTIGIKERYNFKLRQQFIPKKYWCNMTEMMPETEMGVPKIGG